MFFTYNEYQIYYEKHGNKKKNILILPGWGETRSTFINLINSLKKDYTVYIIDYPGFLKSPFPNHDMSIYDYAKIIKAFIKEMNLSNLNILSHSFGGRIAIILAGKYQIPIDKMILIDIAGINQFSLKRKLKTLVYKSLKLLSVFIPQKKKDKYLSYLFRKFSSLDYSSLNSNMYNTFKNIITTDLKKYVKDIRCPSLIIWGNNDPDTPLYIGKYLNKHIPDSGLIILKGTHFIYLEQPFIIYKIIKEFIK